jgi:predicted cobalt transporter CbtA
VGPISTTPVPQGPVPTETPFGGVLPDLTGRARVLPSTGSGPAEGWTKQTTIAAGILAGVGLALLLLGLYQGPVPTETPVGWVLPDLTPRARVLPSTGSGPAEGWTKQTTIAAGILAGVGLALLLLGLYRRPSGRGP